MPDIAKLQALLQDRNSEQPKGRASAPFPVILDADLAVQLNQARQMLTNAEGALEAWKKKATEGDKRQGGSPRLPADLTKAVAEAQSLVDELSAEADDATVKLVFVALKKDKYDELLKLHPPREDNERDHQLQYNADDFPDALMRACVTKVVSLDDDLLDLDIDQIISGLSTGERNVACNVAIGLNLQTFSVPFSAANSPSRQRSGGKSRRR